LADEINALLDEFVGDMKRALDFLFDVIDEDYAEQASGFGYTKKEKLDKIRNARHYYLKHFVSR